MYEIGNDSLRHHVSSFKVNLFLPRLVVCGQPLFQPASQCCSVVSDQLCRATGHFILITAKLFSCVAVVRKISRTASISFPV